jgi:hypothetical protein
MHTSISLSKLLGWILTAGHTAERELAAIKTNTFLMSIHICLIYTQISLLVAPNALRNASTP